MSNPNYLHTEAQGGNINCPAPASRRRAVAVLFSNWKSNNFQEVYFGYAGENLTMRMRLKVFENILRQDAAFFDDPRHSTGKICTRLATDAPNVKQVLYF